MKNLIATLGITGCGKSSWLKDKSPVVETDNLRVELLGSIDDITQESLIFKTAAERIIKLFDTHDTVYFGATLVDSKYRLLFLQSIQRKCEHPFDIDLIIFPADPKISRERIKKDLDAGLPRADSLQYVDEQYTQYLYTMDQLYYEQAFYRRKFAKPFYRKIKNVEEG